MHRLKTFALNRPILFSGLMTLLGIFLTEIPLREALAPRFGLQTAHYLSLILEQGLTGLLFYLLIARFGWLELAGFTPPKQWRALWLGWPLLLFTLLNLDEGRLDFSRPALILLHLLTALSTGWVEEVLCRGLVVTTLLQKWGRTKKGLYLCVAGGGLLFGLAHLVNLLRGRMPLLNNLTQIVFAVFFGVIFAACILRSRTIWPMVLLHASFDWAGTLSEVTVGGGLQLTRAAITPANALVSVLITLPLCLYGLFILRKVDPAALPLEAAR